MPVEIGQTVQISCAGEWLPMIVTHIIDDNYLSGVAFNARFNDKKFLWGRPYREFEGVFKGDGERHWRVTPKPSKARK